MRRARRWWFAGLAVAAAATFAGLWSVTSALRDSRARAEAAQVEFARAQTVRLALWRMDGWMTPRLAREAARPTDDYAAFFTPGTSVNRLLQAVPSGEVLSPSPLLLGTPGWILLHFELDESGTVASPQVPLGNLRDLAEGQYLASGVDPSHVKQLEVVTALVSTKDHALESLMAQAEEANDALLCAADEEAEAKAGSGGAFGGGGELGVAASTSDERSEFATRARLWNSAQQLADSQVSKKSAVLPPAPATAASGNPARRQKALEMETTVSDTSVGTLIPVWLVQSPPTLALVRRVRERGSSRIQGFLVDWDGLRDALLHEVEDLVEDGSIEPVFRASADAEFTPARLASLPAELVATRVRFSPVAPIPSDGQALAVAWSAAILALLAAGAATWAGVSFGDRQARFASSVTHELRTPLTTFQLYSEMLRDGMVPDDARRGQCLDTLCRESRRLGHLVENVLSLARLERGTRVATGRRSGAPLNAQALEALILRLSHERANGATVRFECAFSGLMVRVDEDALSQILGNLLENAAKYGLGPLGTVEVDVHAALTANELRVTVKDHGRGIAAGSTNAIWRPFNRADAAQSAQPGLGIGLTVSQALAQSLGGSLRLLASTSRANGGAEFEVRLPCIVGE